MAAVERYKTNQKIRFIWWGAEENGLVGSFHYTNNLSESEIHDIALYLNFGRPDLPSGIPPLH